MHEGHCISQAARGVLMDRNEPLNKSEPGKLVKDNLGNDEKVGEGIWGLPNLVETIS